MDASFSPRFATALVFFAVFAGSTFASQTECNLLLHLGAVDTAPVPTLAPLRRSDFDPYGHLNSSRYLDLAVDALWRWGDGGKPTAPALTPISDHVLFAEVQYRKAVETIAPVRVVLSRPKGKDESTAAVQFEIQADQEKKLVYARGTLGLRGRGTSDPAPVAPGHPSCCARCGERTHALCGSENFPGPAVIFSNAATPQFSLLDPHGTLELSAYWDLVNSSLWNTLQREHGVDVKSLQRRGLGLFLLRADVTVESAIRTLAPVEVRSWIESISSGKELFTMHFQISALETRNRHAHGKMDFAVMNLSGARPAVASLPEWSWKYFFRVAQPPAESPREDAPEPVIVPSNWGP